MNLILFEAGEIARPLPRTDARAVHIIDVLRRTVGDAFDVGIVNGARGKATVVGIAPESLALRFAWGEPPTPLPALSVIIGLPRPQTARDLLRDGTSLGVTEFHFVRTEKGDPNYGQSTLWSSGEWRRLLIAGAEQAFDTRIPRVTSGHSVLEALATLPAESVRIALDNYESPAALSQCHVLAKTPVVVALGAERGWSERERRALREHGFRFAHLGSRVLRTETAAIAALAILRAKQGLM
ncbi:MAG: RsmE family RNA methyltransferase [Opitutaceae bacterium]|nr:RsmE family RNA methyltransferase [Opitutaceae bacterium]